MATATKTKRTEYINTTQGWVGVRKLNRRNEEISEPVAPGARVFLTDDERELTEQAPQKAEDSLFTPREQIYLDPSTGDEIGRATLCPLELASNFKRSGGKVLPTP